MMKKHRWLSAAMLAALCVSAFVIAGCGKEEKEDTDKVKTEDSDNGKDIAADPGENEEVQTEVSSEETEAEQSDTNSELRTVTLYYVDDQTAEVTGKSIEIRDEYDIWNALKESGLLTEDCELLNLNVNEAEKKMDLDFNSATGERIRSMGSTGETQIIGCIINTYLEAYGCEGIRLTEEGQVLQTSHGANFDGYSGKMTF